MADTTTTTAPRTALNARGDLGTNDVRIMVALADTDERYGDLSEYGIKTLRAAALDCGITRNELGELLAGELERCRSLGIKGDDAGLTAYLRAKRAGSRRVNRSARVAIFAQLMGRRFI